MQVCCWCIGEYGAMLRESCPDLGTGPVTESEVIGWYSKVMWAHHITVVTKQYALISLTKLSTRFPECTTAIQQVEKIFLLTRIIIFQPQAVDGFGSNVDVDLQQRGVEFGQLFRSQAAIRPQILEPMPAMERSRSLEIGGPQIPASSSSTALLENGVSETPVVQESSSTLIDLLGLGDPGETVAEPVVQSSGNMGDILGLGVAPAPTGNLLDGLGGLDLGGPVPSALPATNGGLDNLLNGVDTAAFVTPKETPSLVAYEKHGLRVVFTFPTATATAITLLAHNLTGSSIQEFVFQVINIKSHLEIS